MIFCSNVKGYSNSIVDNRDSVIVNSEVMKRYTYFSWWTHSLIETLYLMSSHETMKDIRKAEQDIKKQGKGIEVYTYRPWILSFLLSHSNNWATEKCTNLQIANLKNNYAKTHLMLTAILTLCGPALPTGMPGCWI